MENKNPASRAFTIQTGDSFHSAENQVYIMEAIRELDEERRQEHELIYV